MCADLISENKHMDWYFNNYPNEQKSDKTVSTHECNGTALPNKRDESFGTNAVKMSRSLESTFDDALSNCYFLLLWRYRKILNNNYLLHAYSNQQKRKTPIFSLMSFSFFISSNSRRKLDVILCSYF